MPRTKAAFPQFDFESLPFARDIHVLFSDGRSKLLSVQNYWRTSDTCVDVIECIDPSVSLDAPENERLPILWIPSPEITSVLVHTRQSTPNHSSHSEIALVFPAIDEVYDSQ